MDTETTLQHIAADADDPKYRLDFLLMKGNGNSVSISQHRNGSNWVTSSVKDDDPNDCLEEPHPTLWAALDYARELTHPEG